MHPIEVQGINARTKDSSYMKIIIIIIVTTTRKKKIGTHILTMRPPAMRNLTNKIPFQLFLSPQRWVLPTLKLLNYLATLRKLK
jgi:hypothetical protein